MPEIICSANYVDGLNVFQVEKETYTEEIVITLYDMRNGRHDLKSKISYLNIGEEYQSRYLNWYNLFFCSANYGAAPDYEYMNSAVQEGRKTAATILLMPSRDGYR